MDAIPETSFPTSPPHEAEPGSVSLFGNSNEVPAANGTNVNVAVFDPGREKEESEYRWPAVMDSILAAPIRIKATKVEVPLYSE
jgi:hypothetical protein